MLRNITRNVVPWNKSILFKKYNISQAIFNVRHKNTTNQHMTTELDDDIEESRPITYSKSKAAHMRIDEYRIPYKDEIPSYQGPIIIASLAVFMIYFCILREENDIDELLYVDLESSLKRCETEQNEKKIVKLASK